MASKTSAKTVNGKNPAVSIVTSLAGIYIAVAGIVAFLARDNVVILVPIAFAFVLLAWIGLHYAYK